MVRKWPGFGEPKPERTAPREVEPRPAVPRPDEQELGEVFCTHITIGGGLTTGMAELPGDWSQDRPLDPDGSSIEGWVAGVPVVDGVADSGWQPCEGGRVRLVVRVVDSPEQREWVRAMSYGGAYAQEVLGLAA